MIKFIKSILYHKGVIAIVFVLTLVSLGIKYILEYALPPSKAKNCDFRFPLDNNFNLDIQYKNSLSLDQKFGTINDASCLNKTAIYGVKIINNFDDVKEAILYAKENNIPITPAGQKHSMGGQSFSRNGIVLDMRGLNQMSLDKEKKILTTQTGAIWADIQKFLDKEGLSVKAMQSINIFTVGGTLSVNAHGIAHNPGPIASTVKSMRIMLSDGNIVTASPNENKELFTLALGGYGLFGIILDVDLQLVDNELYEWETQYIDYKEYPNFYKQFIKDNNDIGLTYARLSVSPFSYLTETAVHTYTKTNREDNLPTLKTDEHTWINRLVINFSKTGSLGRWTRWNLEKYIQPKLKNCITRNQAMSQKELCIVSRNDEMYSSMEYLKNRLPDTDILQEYFVEPDKMPEFVDGLRNIVQANKANLLNVTIRIVQKDTITALPYAKQDMLALVLYFNQKLNNKDSEILQMTTVDLIDLVNDLDGTYYLPYQLYYSKNQLIKSYPEIDKFFVAKREYDKEEIFQNTFYQKYGK